jgi:hypothetical protein
LGKVSRRAASEFSVFDMPPLDVPPLPVRPQEKVAQPAMPKPQPGVSPEELVPIKEESVAAQPALPHPEASEPQPSFEERFGRNGPLILTLIVLVVMFLVGFIIFK